MWSKSRIIDIAPNVFNMTKIQNVRNIIQNKQVYVLMNINVNKMTKISLIFYSYFN